MRQTSAEKYVNDGTTYKDACSWAEGVDSVLKADDPRFSSTVVIVHREGSVMLIQRAFLVKIGHFIVYFSEHQHWRIFHREDLIHFAQFGERQEIESFPPTR